MPKFYNVVDLTKNELQNAVIHVVASDPSSPAEGQFYYNSTSKYLSFYTGSSWIVLGRLDQLSAPTGDVSLNSHKITNLAAPGSGGDAVNKTYADALASAGVSWKNPVRAASTANGTLATAFENGDTLDGITLATGDRILLKDQSTGAENGIYVVAASGAPARATDADTGSEMRGAAVFVEEGTANADQAFVCTTNATITIDSTSLTFVRFTGLGTVTAGAGLTKSGDTLTVGAGTGIVVNADDVALDIPVTIPHGGTGQTTAAAALTALGGVKSYVSDVGDNSSTTITITHNLGTRDVVIQVRRNASPYDVIYPEMNAATTNTVTLVFAVAPTTNEHRVIIMAPA